MGGLGEVAVAGRRELGTAATWSAEAVFNKGVEGVGGASTEGFWGGGGIISGSWKLTVCVGHRERTRSFQSMFPGSDMETIATIRGMDHKKSGEETQGS